MRPGWPPPRLGLMRKDGLTLSAGGARFAA